MPTPSGQIVHLEFTSAFEMLDFVQVVTEHMGRSVAEQLAVKVGFSEDDLHKIGISLRECMVNAVVHGNRYNRRKKVHLKVVRTPDCLTIVVGDEGEGFDPQEVADPLAPENLLKASGRGIFLIRNFMDSVQLRRSPEGGMEISMTKRAQPGVPDSAHA